MLFPFRRRTPKPPPPFPPRIPTGFGLVNVPSLAEESGQGQRQGQRRAPPPHYYYCSKFRLLPKARRVEEAIMGFSRFVPTFPQGLRFLRFLLALITAGILGTAYKHDSNWDSSIKRAGGLLMFTVCIPIPIPIPFPFPFPRMQVSHMQQRQRLLTPTYLPTYFFHPIHIVHRNHPVRRVLLPLLSRLPHPRLHLLQALQIPASHIRRRTHHVLVGGCRRGRSSPRRDAYRRQWKPACACAETGRRHRHLEA